MAGNLSAQLNATPGCIPSKWSRSTIADGDWLQAKTLNPYSTRDNWLAEKIEELSGKSSDDLEEEIRARIAGDTYLSGAIVSISSDFYPFSANVEASAATLKGDIVDESYRAIGEENAIKDDISKLKAATDVIAVFGTYNEFTAASAGDWQQSVTDNDIIKVLIDDSVSSNQVYYEWHDNTAGHQDWSGWSAIGELDPYYSTSEIDDQFAALNERINNTFLSAKNAVNGSTNIDIVEDENTPTITIKTKDNVTFSNLTSTNINATTTKSTNFSGSTLSGERLYSTIDGLIESASNGGAMTALKNVSTINLYNSELEPTTINLTTTADTLGFYVSGGANRWMNFVKYSGIDLPNPTIAITGDFDGQVNSKLSSYMPKAWSGYNDSTFNGSARLAGSADLANSASIAANTQDKITAYYKEGNTDKTGTFNVSSFKLSAGKGINFVSAANQLSISSEGTTYTTGQYIDISNDNKISVTGTLINSAQSGQSAYNWITAQSATLSAGPGIKFTSAGENTMGICVSAGGIGGVITAIAGSALSAGSNYTDSDYIYINPNNNAITLSSHISADNISAHEIKIADGSFSSLLDSSRLNITGNNMTYTASINLSYTKARYDCDGSYGEASWSAIINNANSNCVSSNPAGISISATDAVKLVFTPTLPTPLEDNTYYIV